MTVDIEAIRKWVRVEEAVAQTPQGENWVLIARALLDEVERYKGVLGRIAAHNGDRWIYEGGHAGVRQGTPQEMAREALGDE